jgi:hypothetical protein
MFALSFNLRNPWSDRFQNVWDRTYNTPLAHKFFEVQISRSSDIVDLTVRITTRRDDHAGILVCLGLFTFNLELQIYDDRHWDRVHDRWSE